MNEIISKRHRYYYINDDFKEQKIQQQILQQKNNWNQLLITNSGLLTYQDLNKLKTTNKDINKIIDYNCKSCLEKYKKINEDDDKNNIKWNNNSSDLKCISCYPNLYCKFMISNYLKHNKIFNLNIENNSEYDDNIYDHYKSANKFKSIPIPYHLQSTHIEIDEFTKQMFIESYYVMDIAIIDDYNDIASHDSGPKTTYENDNIFNSKNFFEQTISPGIGDHFINKYIKFVHPKDIKISHYVTFPDVNENEHEDEDDDGIEFYDDEQTMIIVYKVTIDFKDYNVALLSGSMCDLIKDFHSQINLIGSAKNYYNQYQNFDLLWRLSKNLKLNLGKIRIPSRDLGLYTIKEIESMNLSTDLPIAIDYEHNNIISAKITNQPFILYLANRKEDENAKNQE